MFSWDLWQLIDGRDRPDLETRLWAGELDEVKCPKCSASVALVGPLVLLAADGSTHVRFVDGAGSEENASFVAHLMEHSDDPDELKRRVADANVEIAGVLEPRGLVSLREEVIRADAAYDKYRNSGDARDLAAATVGLKGVVASTAFAEAPREFRSAVYNSLALCHQRRYLATDEEDRAIQAQASWKAALELCEPGTERHRAYASNAGLAEASRYTRTHDVVSLDESIRLHCLACESGCRPGVGLAESLAELSVSLFERFEFGGRSADLEQAIERLNTGLEMFPPEHGRRPELLTNLGIMLLRRGDLEAAISVHRSAIELTQTHPTIRPMMQSNLAEALLKRHHLFSRTEDISEAVSLMREAISSSALTNEQRLVLSINLGIALVRQHQLGDAGALEEATRLFDEADHDGNPSQLARARALLGRAMSESYRLSGRPELLDQGAYLLRLAATNITQNDPQRPGIFQSLGVVLDERHDLWGRAEDLTEALRSLEHARELTRGKPDPNLFSSIAIVLRKVYVATREDAHLATLLEIAKMAVSQTTNAAPREKSAAYLALAGALHAAYGAKKDLDMLRRSIATTEQAIALAEPVQRLIAYSSLARKLSDLHAEEHSESSLRSAIEAYRSAITSGLMRYPERALRDAIDWSAWAMGRASWLESVEGAQLAIQAADLLDVRQLSPEHRGHWIEMTAEAHEALAYALARTGDLEGAVEVLENGRARTMRRWMQRSSAVAEESSAASFKDVQRVSSDTTVIYLLAIPQGALALIVEPAGGVRALWLDDYSQDIAQALFIANQDGEPGWLTKYLEWKSNNPGWVAPDELLDTLSQTLELLWALPGNGWLSEEVGLARCRGLTALLSAGA